jgi:N-sulfoglucosamine sulfohydrolase
MAKRHLGSIISGLILGTVGSGACLAADLSAPASRPATERLNVLLITADDMNYDSLGVTGCRIPGITPNIDRLAGEGLRFEYAYVTVSNCQPSRSVLMTGRYPHRNGAMGFGPIRQDVPTLEESLAAAGYVNGIFGKVQHLAPAAKFHWDTVVDAADLGQGRSPELYYQHAKAFFEKSRDAGRPFFLMANSQDPHRPFAGTEPAKLRPRQQRRAQGGGFPDAKVLYSPEQMTVPCFLADLPAVRTELTQFYTSVHRCDQTVGQILKALRDAGAEDRTLVMFLSDNGMPFPFAKTNCYLSSDRTPWIVRWPGKVRPGLESRQMISGVDFMPTILEAAGVKPVEGLDGRSFLPAMLGHEQAGRDSVYTVMNETAGRGEFPIRAVQTRRFGYIFNAWSDGKKRFVSESTGTPTYKAMAEAGAKDPEIAARIHFLDYRVPEELYDYATDPCALHNLVDDPKFRADRDRLRQEMLRYMQGSNDPVLESFKKRIATKD